MAFLLALFSLWSSTGHAEIFGATATVHFVLHQCEGRVLKKPVNSYLDDPVLRQELATARLKALQALQELREQTLAPIAEADHVWRYPVDLLLNTSRSMVMRSAQSPEQIDVILSVVRQEATRIAQLAPQLKREKEELRAALEALRPFVERDTNEREERKRVIDSGLQRVAQATTREELEKVRRDELLVMQTLLGVARQPEAGVRALEANLDPEDPANHLPLLIQLSRLQNVIRDKTIGFDDAIPWAALVTNPIYFDEQLKQRVELRRFVARSVRDLGAIVDQSAKDNSEAKQILLMGAMARLGNDLYALDRENPVSATRQLSLLRASLDRFLLLPEFADDFAFAGLKPLDGLNREVLLARIIHVPELAVSMIGAALPLRSDRPLGISAAQERRAAFRDVVLGFIAARFPEFFTSNEAAAAIVSRTNRGVQHLLSQYPTRERGRLQIQAEARQVREAGTGMLGTLEAYPATWASLAHFYARNPVWLFGPNLPAAIVLTDMINFATVSLSASDVAIWEEVLSAKAELSTNGIPQIFLLPEFSHLIRSIAANDGHLELRNIAAAK